jgi:hypothetical protein
MHESCSAFRSFFTDRVHRSSGRFRSQSERYNKWHDTDADGRWYATASVTAFWEELLTDSGWNPLPSLPPSRVDVIGQVA